jgi:hypothetical protein
MGGKIFKKILTTDETRIEHGFSGHEFHEFLLTDFASPHKSSGSSPVRLAMRESIFGPISSLS